MGAGAAPMEEDAPATGLAAGSSSRAAAGSASCSTVSGGGAAASSSAASTDPKMAALLAAGRDVNSAIYRAAVKIQSQFRGFVVRGRIWLAGGLRYVFQPVL